MFPASSTPPRVMGIVNITRDSFSDGGRYLAPADAVAHAQALVDGGADIIDIGPASTHPDAEDVNAAAEIERIEPVIDALRGKVELSVDSFLPETQMYAIGKGVDFLNDVQGFPQADVYDRLAQARCRLIVMHSIHATGKATRAENTSADPVDRISAFFERRFAALRGAGVASGRLILDPGMGFFLGSSPEPSLRVLRAIPLLKSRFGLPVLISVSRKSFLGAVTGRDTVDRGAATVVAELYAALNGADIVRTHDAAALRDALSVWRALNAGR